MDPYKNLEKKPSFFTRIRGLKWTRLHQFLHDNHGVRYFVMALAIIIATAIAVTAWLYQQPVEIATNSTTTSAAVKPQPVKYYSPLSGSEVADQAATEQPVTAIMIENSPDARPQSGLKDAGIVYEAVAEGGITRFVALYQESKPTLVGPVRSVRPYYVEWAAGYDASVAHVGGSAKALEMIRSGSYGVDIDQFFNAGSYWRATDRYAPHNVYTSFEKLDALNISKGHTKSTFTGWPREDSKKSEQPNATKLNINVSTGDYAVTYEYLPESNTYKRFQGGEAHTDREKGDITPNVVVAIKVPMSLGFEDGYREQIATTGTGQAYVFQNGTVVEGTWSKADAKSPLKLLDANGKEISLVRGQTWVTAVASDRTVSWQ